LNVGNGAKSAGNACRSSNNSVDGSAVAIIFVPGIMGSRLAIKNTSNLWDTWDPNHKANIVGWALLPMDKQREMLGYSNRADIISDFSQKKSPDQVARGWGGVRWESYGEFLAYLENLNLGPVYAYGYDWRQPILQTGCQMAADITGQSATIGNLAAKPADGRFKGGILAHAKTKKCVIITHSMGGLVTRAALKGSQSLRDMTLGVLHGVQPVTGAPVMFRRLITGAKTEFDGSDLTSVVLSTIQGSTGDKFAALMSVLPGAMQLLPSNDYRDDFAAACQSQAWQSWPHDGKAKEIYGPAMRTQGSIPSSGPGSWLSWTEGSDAAKKNQGVDNKTDTDMLLDREHTKSPPGAKRTTLKDPIPNYLVARFIELKAFHDFLKGKWCLPDKTWAFYGVGLKGEPRVHFDLPPSADKDLENRGFNKDKSQDGQGGDGTVPTLSGRALFSGPDGKNKDWDMDKFDPRTCDLGKVRQFFKSGLPHEGAYRDRTVQTFCEAWLRYVINTAPRK
jgi:hypothetical protein